MKKNTLKSSSLLCRTPGVVALGLSLSLLLLSGCASGPGTHSGDPFEPVNRAVFNFNEAVDTAVVKPVATAYRDVTPAPVRRGVYSFFQNISDVWAFANNVLQGKGEPAMDSLFRVTINTVWGVGGIFDVASALQIPQHKEDFGKTLGVWGVSAGPYVVLPLLGPSSVRDTIGTVVDGKGSVMNQIDNVPVRNSLAGLPLVDTRSNLLGVSSFVEEASLDKYTFTRDIYMQRRQSQLGKESQEREERYDLPEVTPTAPASPASAPEAATK